MMWFDKSDPRAVFGDRRSETITVTDNSRGNASGQRVLTIDPDALLDFRALPYPDGSFHLVAFDPPPANPDQRRRAARHHDPSAEGRQGATPMTDAEFDELHGGRELLPIEQAIYEAEGAERFQRFHGHGRSRPQQAEQQEQPN
ncbi:hypothetical protein [Comamonas serinivorans]|uniref:hypothetical protein n=1 Tax=Comamonas serinivorans TaxID=1082851 RepID=UPI001F23EE41|nr:hypothetical protein [Comamonas serinivorans]